MTEIAKPGSLFEHHESFKTDELRLKEIQREVMIHVERVCSDMDAMGVQLCIEEANMNALKHGNKWNPEKMLEVVVRLSEPEPGVLNFHYELQDEGSGFDPEKVPDCTDDANLDKASGRGLTLMRGFMKNVEFINDKGTRVRMNQSFTIRAAIQEAMHAQQQNGNATPSEHQP